ncbi:MAG: hypothetical protein ACI87A_002687 [Planctomycetota bacterium]|jgi:hypothetical protein
MNRSMLRLLAFIVFSTCITPDLHAQSLEQVRQAVDAYFAPDKESAVAKQKLTDWGNDALVHLRMLAGEPKSVRTRRYDDNVRGFEIVCAADTIGTIEAMDLLVEILDWQTEIHASHALLLTYKVVMPMFSETEPGRHIREHPRFRPAIRQFAKSGSWLEKGQAAKCAASLGWTDFESLIEDMLEDPNISLRREAAEALEELTGLAVELDVPAARFPARKPIPSLLSKPEPVSTNLTGRIDATFLIQHGEGSPTIMIGNGRQFEPLLSSTGASSTLDFAVPAIDVDVLEVDGAPRQLIALTSKSGFGGAGADYATSWNEDGQEVWRYEPPKSGLDAFAILYGQKGPYGVTFGPGGGDEGIVALDEHGKQMWSAHGIVLYELRTHRDLPGVLLYVGGERSLWNHSPAGLQTRQGSGMEEDIYASTGILYPGRYGSPEMAIAGSDLMNSTPTLIGQDARGKRLWTATFTHGVAKLALLEIVGREKLIVAATSGGDLYILNTAGTLYWEGKIPSSGEKNRVTIFDLIAGNYGDGLAAVVISTVAGYHYYPLNIEAIPSSR